MNSITSQTNSNESSLKEYISKKDFGISSICPVTDSELNWIFKQREYNGFKKDKVMNNKVNFIEGIR